MAEPRSGAAPDRDTLAERLALAQALRALPSDQQLAVHLRLVEGYSFAEVARLMGRSRGACQMLVLRAGRQLRAALEREGIRAGA
jgi:RNA polymerase sigma-70 factor (ECF subfamily)